MYLPIPEIIIIITVILLWKANSGLDNYLLGLKTRVSKEKREHDLRLELDQVGKEHDDLVATFNMYQDLNDQEKCKQIQKQCAEYSTRYHQLKERLKA
jgi:hypothetical protein